MNPRGVIALYLLALLSAGGLFAAAVIGLYEHIERRHA